MEEHGDYALYYRILLLEMFANCIDISWFYQGLENFKKTALRNIVVKLISVVSIFIFIKNENDVAKYLLIYVLTTLLGNASLWLGIKKYIVKIKIKDLQILKQLKPTIYLFIPQIAIQVYTVLDKTMIGAITNNMSEVGYYEQTQKIIKILMTIITSLGTVMMPRIAKCYADGAQDKIKEYMKNTFSFVYLLAFPMIFGIIAVSNSFVPFFFGDGYEKVKLLMKVMSPIILFIGLSNVTGTQYLLSTKKQKQFTISVICGAIVNAILNLILINMFDALGAVIATVIAELTVTAVQIYYVKDDFNFKEIIKSAKNYILSSLFMFLLCFIIGRFIQNNKVSIIAQVLVGAITYVSCLLILKDRFIFEFLNRVKDKIKGK